MERADIEVATGLSREDLGFEIQDRGQDRAELVPCLDRHLPPDAGGKNVASELGERFGGLSPDGIDAGQLETEVVVPEFAVIARVEEIAGHPDWIGPVSWSCLIMD
jgi:hypothetical protein